MRYLVDSAQMKAADQYTIREIGIPSMELMERAAACCVDVMLTEGLDLSRPCIVCGSGNNGGDGMAIARLLAGKGYPARVCFIGTEDHCTRETKQQLQMLRGIGIEICNEYVVDEYSIIIDAVFGVGLNRQVTGIYQQVLGQMNLADAVKFAVDMPSGVSADNGTVLGSAFRADITVTFQAEKLGLMLSLGRESAGKVTVADIGIDMTPMRQDKWAACTYETCDYRELLPMRRQDSQKGDYGKLLVIAGSRGMSGAAYLNAKAAYMAGAGLVRIYTPEENRVILQQQLPEAIVTTYESYDEKEILALLKWADTVCIGSGIGMGDTSRRIWRTVMEHVDVPCLMDADGLNLLAEEKWYLEGIRRRYSRFGNFVLTPHMKEMSRLVQLGIGEIKSHRVDILKEYMEDRGITCVLKDSRTIIASPGKRPCVNLSGNAAMAKAGSGDVLAGVIAGLMAQGMNGYDASVLGTYLHGRAGDYARKLKGNYSVLARDLVECLSNAIKELDQEE